MHLRRHHALYAAGAALAAGLAPLATEFRDPLLVVGVAGVAAILRATKPVPRPPPPPPPPEHIFIGSTPPAPVAVVSAPTPPQVTLGSSIRFGGSTMRV